METIFINTENSKAKQTNRFRYYFIDKFNLKTNKTIALGNLSICFTWKNVKSEYENNKFEITAPTWNEKNLIYQMDLILYLIILIIKIILNTLSKNMKPLQMKILL